MNKIDIDKELGELIFRFKRLKKAMQEEESLSPAQRAAVKVAQSLTRQVAAKANTLKKTAPSTEQVQAQSLANMLKSRGILGAHAPPRQPTDEEMFGHMVQSEKVIQKAEQAWGNSINNWMAEATKPINAKFKTPEEEQAYWDSIKVNGSDGGNEGY